VETGEKVPIGVGNLDGLLSGGFDRGVVTSVCGPPGSGKTTFGILLALACLRSGPVAFLDSEGGLSAERILQIGPKADLKRILLKRIFDFRSQEKVVLALSKQKCSAIIVDSIVHNYRLLLTDRTAREVNLRLSAQIAELNKIASEKNIPVLVTGHTYRKKDGEIGLAGGAVMEYLPKTIVLLEKTGEGKRQAIIYKSRSLPEGKTAEFSVVEKGFA
ncbi:MAG: ATPase domain-containing protein, partial [archaeon]